MGSIMEFAFYLGCVAPHRYPGIEAATRKVFSKLSLGLVDMKGASCCPPPGVIRSFDIDTWLLTAARNLAIAERLELDMVTMCNGCYATLKEANYILKTDEEKRKHINSLLSEIGYHFEGKTNVRHIIEVLYFDVGIGSLKSYIKKKISARVAVFYGCHLVKPSNLRPWKDPERPRFLDEMVEALGAESVEYEHKMMCCGAGGAVRSGNPEVSLRIAQQRLHAMKEAKAECIVDVCPFCHLQFDLGQREIAERWGDTVNLPVLYYTQLLGMAMGLDPEELGVYMNVTDCSNLVKRF